MESTNTTRLSLTLSPIWQAAFRQVWAAYRMGSIPIGAVVADVNGKIISQGRNRRHESQGEGAQLAGTLLAHAEMNALLEMPNPTTINPRTCTLYTTTEPCPLCCGALVMANIRSVAFASRDLWAGRAEEMLRSTPYLRQKNIRVTGPQNDRFEGALIAIQAEYIICTHGENSILVEMYRMIAPDAALLGKQLAESGELRSMATTETDPLAVLDMLESRLTYR